jgi:DNA-binding transcriptional regulator YhcF (GntR family)
MEIRIDRTSELPIRQQLAEQMVFLIVTDRLKPGEPLPSVRELARRLKIHHNTVSEAYRELVRRGWVERKRGARLCVPPSTDLAANPNVRNLDQLINITIRVARDLGYSLQALRERVRDRLLAQPPDHILIVENDDGLRRIMCSEVQRALSWPVHSCTRQELAANPGLAIGALAIAQSHATEIADALLPKERSVLPVRFSSADEHIRRVRSLGQPSTIFIVSTSSRFLQTARGLLAPVIGRRHSLKEILVSGRAPAIDGADLIFCDSIAARMIRRKSALVEYCLLDPQSLAAVSATMVGYGARE